MSAVSKGKSFLKKKNRRRSDQARNNKMDGRDETKYARKQGTLRKFPKIEKKNIISYKKVEKYKCNNYKAMYLSSISFKICTRLIEKGLRRKIERELGEEQAAFKINYKRYSTKHHKKTVSER